MGLGALALAGCIRVGPDYTPLDAPIAPQWPESDDQRIETGPADVAAWWRSFDHAAHGDGDMVPLVTMVDIGYRAGRVLINLYDLDPAAQILGRTGISYQEKLLGAQAYYVFALALALVYFVLAAQYESWLIPVAVLLAVPIAVLGTVTALSLVGVANNLYMQIGVVLLIALAAKNAILVVEYPRNLRVDEGRAILDAAVEAARLRFRPILMTSFAFILGVPPLVFATGAGANARRSIGITVVSGMLASTCIAILLVPSFFVVLQRLSERRRKGSGATSTTPTASAQPAQRTD